MSEAEFDRMVTMERLRDWRFWVCYMISGFLLFQLVTWFLKIENVFAAIIASLLIFYVLNKIFHTHYRNVIAHEKGINIK